MWDERPWTGKWGNCQTLVLPVEQSGPAELGDSIVGGGGSRPAGLDPSGNVQKSVAGAGTVCSAPELL